MIPSFISMVWFYEYSKSYRKLYILWEISCAMSSIRWSNFEVAQWGTPFAVNPRRDSPWCARRQPFWSKCPLPQRKAMCRSQTSPIWRFLRMVQQRHFSFQLRLVFFQNGHCRFPSIQIYQNPCSSFLLRCFSGRRAKYTSEVCQVWK